MSDEPVGATFGSPVIETANERETTAVGESLGKTLQAGAVVLLYGDLGAGKTAFVRGLARGIGADPDEVSSPTFTLVQEYAGPRMTLFHVDLYRLEPAEIDDLGLEDLMSGQDVVAVEWAERWRGRPDAVAEVTIEDAGQDRRRIRIDLPSAEQPPDPGTCPPPFSGD